jgi:hypothetical protein
MQAAHEAFEGSKGAAGAAWHSDAAHQATNHMKVTSLPRCILCSLVLDRRDPRVSVHEPLRSEPSSMTAPCM